MTTPASSTGSSTLTTLSSSSSDALLSAPATLTLGRLHGAAVVRIAFGVLWAVDATFKWLPGFIHGQTLGDELGKAADVQTPVFHQWLQMWHAIGTSVPGAFAVGTAVIETLIALGLLLGAFSNVVFIGSAVFSFGIWSGAEGFHLPWKQGMTDLGPSVGYIFASLALYYAFAGSSWSLDTRLRPALGRYGRLCGRPAG
ncbi:hypothetical protein [Streptomyces sp. NBC_01497]|uniref:hypothetical protein n=1 Tax=Streptomyces sp. NBC_01497 TaxID=2903885 RepID=UPI002E3328EC|nr:hypothetical protein [Streptomyces sp. NBC_01497]